MCALVMCFGEALWDVLPDGSYVGGAPVNVAYHLRHLGIRAHVVSAVGRDRSGDRLLAHLRRWGLDVTGVATHRDVPTGTVRVSLSACGEPRFEIASNVAWDRIVLLGATIDAARRASALVFGSLAQRSPRNRAILTRLLTLLPANAERVFDVNLRPPYTELHWARELACHATLLKLNAAEAALLAADGADTPGAEETHARALATAFGVRSVCITAGTRGAGLLHAGRWFWHAARDVQVRDTVGAGDAFLAALLVGRLRGREPGACISRAARLAEWVAMRSGATPSYDDAPRELLE